MSMQNTPRLHRKTHSFESRKSSLKRSSSIIPMVNDSIINIFLPPSTSSSEEFQRTGIRKGMSMDHNRHLVHDIINGMFDERRGQCDVSSSPCSSLRARASEYSFDKRLRYWKQVLADRRTLSMHIRQKIGKHQSKLLYNRGITIDDRDKQTVKRLLDYAERMNPLTLIEKQESRLKEYIDPCTCQRIRELRETLPKAERDHGTKVEITGLPAVAKEEILGHVKQQGVETKSLWLKSKVLEQHIEDKREDIERVIEYYPDIEHLQIVGESLTKSHQIKHNEEITLVGEEYLRHISSESSVCEKSCKNEAEKLQRTLLEAEPTAEYGIKINDQVFKLLSKRSARKVEIKVCFECEPFETVNKRVLRLENVGTKVINFEWVQRPYYDKTGTLLKALDEEFIFNHKSFRLVAGESRNIIVQYQPRKVDIVKEKWLLKIDPQFFCRKLDSVSVRLSGKCVPPPVYVTKLNEILDEVVEKSNVKMMRKLTSGLSEITPLIKPNEVICPYKRTLDERELFEFYNIGYRCERYHDLELLKDIHKRVKRPREPAWDLKLDSLKELILRLSEPEQRALVFNELLGVLEEMRGQPEDFEERIDKNPERERTCFVFVRGIVTAGIDEWEELTLVVEEAFLRPAIKEYIAQLIAAQQEEAAAEESTPVEEENAIDLLLLDEEGIKRTVLKQVRRNKAFRDALYVQTYTVLCNFVEDIVSVIESTDII